MMGMIGFRANEGLHLEKPPIVFRFLLNDFDLYQVSNLIPRIVNTIFNWPKKPVLIRLGV
jgi:hypothetical protein